MHGVTGPEEKSRANNSLRQLRLTLWLNFKLPLVFSLSLSERRFFFWRTKKRDGKYQRGIIMKNLLFE